MKYHDEGVLLTSENNLLEKQSIVHSFTPLAYLHVSAI